jgi:hypothetical protein
VNQKAVAEIKERKRRGRRYFHVHFYIYSIRLKALTLVEVNPNLVTAVSF